MKEIILMRHGEAGWDAATDRERHLTERGKQQAYATAEQILQMGFVPDVILHSPYLRTCETTAEVSKLFPQTTCVIHEGITPDGNGPLIVDALHALPQQKIWVITHNPFVSDLLHLLVEGTAYNPANLLPVYGTACAAWLQGEDVLPGVCELKQFFTPNC